MIKEGRADEKRTIKFLYSVAAALFLLLTAALPAEAAQNWMQVYAHVEQMINKGVEQYNNGDLEGAKKIINDSYYGVYENDGLEKAIRTTISSKNANPDGISVQRAEKSDS